MSLARDVLLRASRSRWIADQMMRRAFARRAVKRFMPGEEVTDALGAAEALAAAGIGAVLTKLGENVTTLAEAQAVRDHYLGVFDLIARRGLASQPSVKPTQLGLDLSFDACLASLESLAAKADSSGSLLWIDMEDSSYVDRTLDLFRRLRNKHARVGLALQAYLYRTPKDVEALLRLKPIIRLVKGAYAEPPAVAYPKKSDVDAAYFAIGQTLLASAASGGSAPIFGTHDIRLIARLAAKASELGVKEGGYEIHMLYGIRSTEQRMLVADGHTVRVLISYGNAWFPWYMRRLAERPANVWFVMKSMFA